MAAAPAIDRLWSDFARTWSSHDMDQVLPLYTDDCIYEDVTLGAVNHGKVELRRFGQMFISGFPDVRFEMTSGFVAANWAGLARRQEERRHLTLPGFLIRNRFQRRTQDTRESAGHSSRRSRVRIRGRD